MKNDRQNRILELIRESDIETQEQLRSRLLEEGFSVTQATVSRDIKKLGLVKKHSRSGNYSYTVPESVKTDRSIFFDIAKDADYALNTVVIKCRNGMAQAACASLDSMHFDNIVGTLAGDDTIFVLMRTENDAESLVKTFRKLIRR